MTNVVHDALPFYDPFGPPTRVIVKRPRYGDFLLWTAVFLPLALIPYFPLRRQVSALRAELTAIQSARTASVDNAVNSVAETQAVLSSSLSSINSTLLNLNEQRNESDKSLLLKWEDIDKRSHDTRNQLQREVERWNTSQTSRDQILSKELSHIREQLRQRKELPSKVLRELGISLGHVAAFVEEVEVKDGLLSGERDPRGVHGMRKLALQLETIAKESSDKSGISRPKC